MRTVKITMFIWNGMRPIFRPVGHIVPQKAFKEHPNLVVANQYQSIAIPLSEKE